MITKMNHVSIFVLDQDSAYDFYVNKLGFKVHTDAPMGPGKRWLPIQVKNLILNFLLLIKSSRASSVYISSIKCNTVFLQCSPLKQGYRLMLINFSLLFLIRASLNKQCSKKLHNKN